MEDINLNNNKEHWDLVIEGKTSLFDLKFADVWRYRDLLLMFVKRDFVSFYKQTILGPLWFLIQPIFKASDILSVLILAQKKRELGMCMGKKRGFVRYNFDWS